MRNYELIVIAVPQLDDESVASLNQRVAGWITAGNGSVTGTDVWGRRQLMYAIRKHSEGIYVKYDFQLPPSAVRELDRSLRLEEQIIRHLVVRLDED
ncbi:MAG: 30S ribosomal protein S6 [Chloroflexi bacterium HGW-Chloroflexi-1]|nr:MAG: 30S ribosomal protein S6 [Chloroflexi bacterium HGW-Chloroflexi-1]